MIAIIHFLASTGTRPEVLTDPPLQFKHLKKLSDDCYTVKIYDESSEGYWAFLTTEASRSFDAYIRTRKLNGEHLDETSYLFATKQNARTRKNDYLSQDSVSRALSKIYCKARNLRHVSYFCVHFVPHKLLKSLRIQTIKKLNPEFDVTV